MCALPCTNDAEKNTITREEEAWCEATRTTTKILNFCCASCVDEFAENKLLKEFGDIRVNLSETYDHSKPRFRRCVECASRCSDEISLEGHAGNLNFCGIGCFGEFADRQLRRDFAEGTL